MADFFDIILDKFSKNLMKKNKGVGVKHTHDVKSKSESLRLFNQAKRQYKSSLFKNMQRFLSGKDDKDTYLKNQKASIQAAYEKSFILGKMYNQISDLSISDDERRSIIYQVKKEMGFMSNFADDIANQTGRMNYKRRLGMYVDGLVALFQFGNILYMPEDIIIWWRLGVTDKHCLDCLFYAANNPYTKKTLPTVPKGGSSACLSHCLCSLSYQTRNVNSEYDDFAFRNYVDNGGVLPDFDQYNKIKTDISEYYWNRLMWEYDRVDKYIDTATEIKNNINSYIKDNGLAISVPLRVMDTVSEFRMFSRHKNFEFIEDYQKIKLDDFVSVFVSGKQQYGKVVGRYGFGFYVKVLEGETVKIEGKNALLFKEITL